MCCALPTASSTVKLAFFFVLDVDPSGCSPQSPLQSPATQSSEPQLPILSPDLVSLSSLVHAPRPGCSARCTDQTITFRVGIANSTTSCQQINDGGLPGASAGTWPTTDMILASLPGPMGPSRSSDLPGRPNRLALCSPSHKMESMAPPARRPRRTVQVSGPWHSAMYLATASADLRAGICRCWCSRSRQYRSPEYSTSHSGQEELTASPQKSRSI